MSEQRMAALKQDSTDSESEDGETSYRSLAGIETASQKRPIRNSLSETAYQKQRLRNGLSETASQKQPIRNVLSETSLIRPTKARNRRQISHTLKRPH